MKIRTVNYSQSRETLHGFGLKKWDKIGMDIELEDGDTPDKAYALAHQFVTEKLNQNQIQEQEMKGSHTVDIGEQEHTAKEKEDEIKNEYMAVEAELNNIEFQEDAIAYLNTTTFKHFIPAKTLANSKPLKNK